MAVGREACGYDGNGGGYNANDRGGGRGDDDAGNSYYSDDEGDPPHDRRNPRNLPEPMPHTTVDDSYDFVTPYSGIRSDRL